MNRDPETLLGSLTPLGPPHELRERVLAKVAAELTYTKRFHWERWCGVGIAAGLLFGALMNAYVSWKHDQQLAVLLKPDSSFSQAASIARHSDWQPFSYASGATDSFTLYAQTVDRLLRDFDAGGKEKHREETKKNSQDRSALPGSPAGDLADWQRHHDPDYRQLA
jgi:hypothetical protein